MAKKEVWCVKESCYYDEESPGRELVCGVKLCKSEEDAIMELNRTIREDWTSEVEIDGETKSLADCRGMQEDPDSLNYSEWYYSKDGKLAWHRCLFRFSYRGEVARLEVEV